MNASDYYARNAQLHPPATDGPPATLPESLGATPSEPDMTLFWLAEARCSGALLDVGCGHLDLLIRASSLFAKRQGVDIAASESWARHPEIEAGAHNMDEADLPLPTASFDAVTCLMVLEHVFNPFHTVRELRRVCKPGGRVVIGVPNIAGIKHRLTLLRGRLPITSARFSFEEQAWDGYHLHQFTQTSLRWLLRREGLRPLRWGASGGWQVFKRWRPALFGGDLLVMAEPCEPQPRLPIDF